jgi:hypothetical protein
MMPLVVPMGHRSQRARATGRLGALAQQLAASSRAESKPFDGLTDPLDAPAAAPGSYVFPTSGLFIDDYSALPKPTSDMAAAKHDMDVFGYCILKDMLPADQLARLREKLVAQAAEDEVEPSASGRNFPILASMQNKGPEFLELLDNPKVLEVVGHTVGEHFHFQILNQAWHTGGKKAAPLHTDQWWYPPPARKSRRVRVPTGSITRPGAFEATWHPEPPHEDYISPSVRCTAIWMVTDFTPDNGAVSEARGPSLAPGCCTFSSAAFARPARAPPHL